jgi:predicted dehydrogenase
VEGDAAIEKLKALIHEGNVRSSSCSMKGERWQVFADAGVVGAVLDSVVGAIAALMALLKDARFSSSACNRRTTPNVPDRPQDGSCMQAHVKLPAVCHIPEPQVQLADVKADRASCAARLAVGLNGIDHAGSALYIRLFAEVLP